MHLTSAIQELANLLLSDNTQPSVLASKCELILHLLIKGNETYMLRFNHVLGQLVESALYFVISTRVFIFEHVKERNIDSVVISLSLN
jgi:hypothetical protein